MKRLLAAIILLAGVTACNNKTSEDHAHAPDGSHPGEEGLKSLSYTLYSNSSELFVEFKPLVVGQTSRFAVHLTKLGQRFVPYTTGKVTVSLISSDKGIRQTANAPSSPGIFPLALQPNTAGPAKLIFDIQTQEFTDQFIIDSITIYTDEKAAIKAQPGDAADGDISYLKEQAWKVEFANAPVKKDTIYNVIKATGEILPAPGGEVTIAAKSNGILKFAGNTNVIGSAIRTGQPMFRITGGEIAFENVEATVNAARAELATAKSEFERSSELIKDKLITRSDFESAKLRYDQAQIAVNNLQRNYSSSGKSLSSPINGFIKNIMVREGQYVTAGQPLAVITKNTQLMLRVDLSLKHADNMSAIQEANFFLIQNKQSYNTNELNGKLVSAGKTTGGDSPFIPVHFQIDGKPEMIPGSYAEVFLKTTPIIGALVVPTSSLVEEQGNFYAYVQTAGENFQKRKLKLGANDGQNVQILSGLTEGERVVTKGAYQIKLSQSSGSLPAHGHEH